MQYLLSKDEYYELKEKARELNSAYKDRLQYACTMAATYAPALKSEHPNGCILSPGKQETSCDRCPVEQTCPYEFKEYLK